MEDLSFKVADAAALQELQGGTWEALPEALASSSAPALAQACLMLQGRPEGTGLVVVGSTAVLRRGGRNFGQQADSATAAVAQVLEASADRFSSDDVSANLLYTENHPQPGVLFQDMQLLFSAPLLPLLVEACVRALPSSTTIECVVGVEARGLALGALLALRLQASFVMARKHGKLVPPVLSQAYGTEYSKDILEVSLSSPLKNHSVLIVDDLIATGGSLLAAASLVRRAGGSVVCCFAPLCVAPLWPSATKRFADENIDVRTLS